MSFKVGDRVLVVSRNDLFVVELRGEGNYQIVSPKGHVEGVIVEIDRVVSEIPEYTVETKQGTFIVQESFLRPAGDQGTWDSEKL